MTKPFIPRQNVQKLIIEISGGWYMEKIMKGLPPLRRQKLSKNHKRGRMKFKKLCEANRHWNYWKLQIYWHKVEWVSPRSQIKRKSPYSVSFKKN